METVQTLTAKIYSNLSKIEEEKEKAKEYIERIQELRQEVIRWYEEIEKLKRRQKIK